MKNATKKEPRFVVLLALINAALCATPRQSRSQTTDVNLIGACDIADGFAFNLSGAFGTAALLDANPTVPVFACGDLAYDNGTDDFMQAYDATWGRARARTIPAPGHHEYTIQNGTGFYNYWGPAAGNSTKGYYSLNLGAWHLISLNGNCSQVGCAAGSAQELWLKKAPETHTQACTLAAWHEPLYSSTTEFTPYT